MNVLPRMAAPDLAAFVQPSLLGRLAGLARRVDAGVCVLIALPWLVLVADPLWVYGGFSRDTWAYFGAFQDLPGHLKVHSHYLLSRLSQLLPGWAAYSLFPPQTANLVLHFGVYYAAVLSGYAALSRTVGRRAGLLAMIAMGGHFFFLRAAGWDYVDGYAIAYFLMATALLARAGSAQRFWRVWTLAAGAACGALVVAYLAFILLLIPLAGFALVANRCGGRRALDTAGFWLGAGFFGSLAGFAVASKALGGPLLFLLPSFNFVQSFGAEHRATFIHPPSVWLPRASWLLLPATAGVGALVALVRMAIRRGANPFAAWFQFQFLGLAAMLVVAQWRGDVALLQHRPQANATVMVTGFLALAGQWAGWLDRFSTRRFLGLAAVWCAIVVLSCLSAERLHKPGGLGQGIPLWAALGCGLLAGGLAQVCPPRVWAGAAVVAMLAVVNIAARSHFRFTDAIHGLDNSIRLERYEEFDPDRKTCFKVFAETARWSRGLAPPGKVWFWYNLDDRLGPVYDMAAHTNFFVLQIVNTRFPWLMDGKVYRGDQVQVIGRNGGGAVVVLSDDPAAAEKALYWIRGCGMAAEFEEERIMGSPPIAIRAVVIRVARKYD